MATGKTIESIWSGDILTWYLPTNYKDAPHPPIGALKAWAVDAGLRDGDKIVLHHVASVGDVVSRPDGVRDRAIGIRRTTKTASMSGYMVVNAPEQAQLLGDVPVPTATTEWLARRVVPTEKSLPDLQADAMTVDQAKAVIGEVSSETTLKELVEAADHKGCEIHIQLTPTKVASQDVIEEPATEPALSSIDMIARGEGEVSLADAADYLRITVEQAEQLIDEGALVGRRIGEVWYVDAASVAKLLHTPKHKNAERKCGMPGPFDVLCERKYSDCRAINPANACVHEGGGYRWDYKNPATHADGSPLTFRELVDNKNDPQVNDQAPSNFDFGSMPSKSNVDDAKMTQSQPDYEGTAELAMYTALDNANERLHGDVTRLNIELSTLRQCIGRLQGAIEAKTGTDTSEHTNDPVALTKALIAALMPNRKPYLAPIDTTIADATKSGSAKLAALLTELAPLAQAVADESQQRTCSGNEIVAMQNASATTVAPKVDVNTTLTDEGIKIVATTNTTPNVDLFDRAKVAGDDLKVMLREMDTPRDRTPSPMLQPETNYFFDDVHKNHREPG